MYSFTIHRDQLIGLHTLFSCNPKLYRWSPFCVCVCVHFTHSRAMWQVSLPLCGTFGVHLRFLTYMSCNCCAIVMYRQHTHMHMLSYLVPPLLGFAPRWKAKDPTGETRPCSGVLLPVPTFSGGSTFLCRLFSPHRSHLPANKSRVYHQLLACLPAGSHYNINALSSIVYRHYLPLSIRFASSRHGVFSVLQSGWLSVFF